MTRLTSLVAAVSCTFIVGAGAGAQPLPTDPRLVTGELDNGLHYIVVKHGKPEGRAVMWLHVQSGSMNEKDNQRGLAHYLEHLGFNGSANFPPGSLVAYFESLGLRFGGDLNAFTNTDQTTFQITLPNTEKETLAKGMLFLSDVAFRLSLLPAEIDAERQIILNEKMTGLSAGRRIGDYISQHIAPGSLVGDRLTIGIDETIKGAQREDFVDYYKHWYVASNMTVIVVADTDTARVAEQVKKSFADGAPPKAPRPAPQDPRIMPYTSTRAIIATDPDLRNASVQITRLWPGIPVATTEEMARRDLVMSLGSAAFNRRMQNKLSKGGMAFLNANAGSRRFFHSAALASQVSCGGKPENWQTMLGGLGTELQRARLHGFTAREIEDLKTQRISGAEERVQRESSMQASNLIRMIDSSLTDGEPIMSAQQDLDLLRKQLPTITPEEISRKFAELFEPTNVAFIVELPSSAQVPSEAELISLGTAAVSVKPEAEAETARATTLLSKVPEAGKVVEQGEHAASKVWSGWLSNGVRVHQREMDAQEDAVTVTITLAGGTIQETAKNRGITSAAELAWSRPATSTLSSTDFRDLMTGKKVRVGGGGGGFGGGRGGRGGGGGGGGGGLDAITLRVSGNPEDLETGMQAAYLLLTDPVIEPAAFDQWKTRELQQIEARDKEPGAAFGVLSAQALYPASEARLQPITAAQVNAMTRESAQAWLRNLIATAPIEVSVVGDLPRDRAIELVSRYLGSLPTRERIGHSTLASLRNVSPPKGPVSKSQTIQTGTNQARVLSGFLGPDATNVADSRAMQVASRILSTRMVKVIREEKNLVYSIGASFQPGRALPGFGMFGAGAPAEPQNADPLAATIMEMFAEFAKTGPTEEEMTVAKKQFATELERSMKEAPFWLGATTAIDYHGTKLDDVLGAPEAYQALTAEQVHTTFAKYCKPESSMTIILKPDLTDKPASGDEKPAGK